MKDAWTGEDQEERPKPNIRNVEPMPAVCAIIMCIGGFLAATGRGEGVVGGVLMLVGLMLLSYSARKWG